MIGLNKLLKLKTAIVSKRSFLKNYIFLNVSRGMNLVLPLIVTPYIIRVVGLSNFGSVAVLQALSAIFIILGNYGLDVINIIQISKNRGNSTLLRQVIVDNYLVKTVNLTFLFFFFYLGAYIFAEVKDLNIILSSYLMVISAVYLPDFYFQGTEKVFNLMILNVCSKILLVVLLVLFIKRPGDYIYINFIYGSAQLVVPVIGAFFFPSDFFRQGFDFSFRRLVSIYKQNMLLMLSNLSSNLFSSSTSLLLSLYLSKSDVGLFVAIERIINILKGFVGVLSQALYAPVTLIYRDMQRLIKYYSSILVPFGALYLFICLLVFIYASRIGLAFSITEPIFKIGLRLFLLSALLELVNLPVVQYLVVSGQNSRYFKMIALVCGVNLLLNVVSIPFFGLLSCIVSLTICQILIFFHVKPAKLFKSFFF